jgi:hypothetical protein
MNQLLPQEVVDQIMREEQHFAPRPKPSSRHGSAVSRSLAPNGSATAPVKA